MTPEQAAYERKKERRAILEIIEERIEVAKSLLSIRMITEQGRWVSTGILGELERLCEKIKDRETD